MPLVRTSDEGLAAATLMLDSGPGKSSLAIPIYALEYTPK